MSNRSNYTATDLANASKYAQINVDKLLLNAMHGTHPHLISHCTLVNGQLVANQTFLAQFNCVMFKNGSLEPCTAKDTPHWLRTGDESFKLGCNWSCFNLKPLEYDDKKQAVPQTAEWRLRSDGTVELFPTTNYWFEFPLLRSDERYRNRVNNLAAGFDTKTDGSYRLNDSYCESFVSKYDRATDTCKSEISPVLSFVFGEAVVKNTLVLTRGIGSKLPLSGKAKAIPSYSTTLQEWKALVDPKWHMQVPDPIDPSVLPVEADSTSYIIPAPPKPLVTITETTVQVVIGLIKSLFTVEFWSTLAVQVAFETITRQLANQLNKRVLIWLADIAAEQQVLLTALTRSLVAYGLRFVQLELIKYALQALAWTVTAALDVVGIALVVTAVLDVVLEVLDPYNLNQELSSKQLASLQQQMEERFYQQDRVRILLTPSLLAEILQVPDREQIQLQSILYTYQYLKSLKVNSDGFPIIRDFSILERTDNTQGPIPVSTVSVYQDIAAFQERAECFKLFRRATLALSGLLILTLIARFYMLSLVLMVLIVFILGVTYLNLSFDVPRQVTGTFETLKQLLGTVAQENKVRFKEFSGVEQRTA